MSNNLLWYILSPVDVPVAAGISSGLFIAIVFCFCLCAIACINCKKEKLSYSGHTSVVPAPDSTPLSSTEYGVTPSNTAARSLSALPVYHNSKTVPVHTHEPTMPTVYGSGLSKDQKTVLPEASLREDQQLLQPAADKGYEDTKLSSPVSPPSYDMAIGYPSYELPHMPNV